jgi:hypothetical protein
VKLWWFSLAIFVASKNHAWFGLAIFVAGKKHAWFGLATFEASEDVAYFPLKDGNPQHFCTVGAKK